MHPLCGGMLKELLLGCRDPVDMRLAGSLAGQDTLDDQAAHDGHHGGVRQRPAAVIERIEDLADCGGLTLPHEAHDRGLEVAQQTIYRLVLSRS